MPISQHTGCWGILTNMDGTALNCRELSSFSFPLKAISITVLLISQEEAPFPYPQRTTYPRLLIFISQKQEEKKSSKKPYGSLKLELAAHSYKHQTEQLQPCSHNHPLVRKGITSPRLPGAKPAQHLARNLGGETCQ